MGKIERVDDEIKKHLNVIISRELKDPRISNTLVSVTDVETAKDLKTANVYVSIMDKTNAKTIISVLKTASSHIRGLLFERLKIRMVPHLTFILDDSMERGLKIDNILKEIKKADENGENL